jgi:hypothetical protein
LANSLGSVKESFQYKLPSWKIYPRLEHILGKSKNGGNCEKKNSWKLGKLEIV